MPVYGQPTEFNERLCSLMSCVFYNSNKLYDGMDLTIRNFSASTPQRLSSQRPLFTESILRKSSRLKEIRTKPNSCSTGESTSNTATALEVILVSSPGNRKRCTLLTNLVSHLLAMPEEHSSDLILEVSAVSSNSIREDIHATRSSRSSPGNNSAVGKQRRQVYVALGSAMEGLCLYLHQEEVSRLRLRGRKNTISPGTFSYPTSSILAVVCIDPPPHLWKACGRSILDQTSIQGIPSFFVGYTEKDGDGAEQIPITLGHILDKCMRHPHVLALVAKNSAKILRPHSNGSSNAKDEEGRDFDACVWTARLVAKYAESILRIRAPPGRLSLYRTESKL